MLIALISFFLISKYFYYQSYEYKLGIIGYSKDEVSILKENLTEKQLDIILDKKKNTKIVKLVKLKNFKFSKLDRYLQFDDSIKLNTVIRIVNQNADQLNFDNQNVLASIIESKYYIKKNIERYLTYYTDNSDLYINEIIKRVNSNLDYSFYTNITDTDMAKKNLVIANKFYKLDKDYVPDNLVNIDNNGHQLQSEAADAYKKMIDGAASSGYYYKVNSAYRSYNTQSSLYNSYVKAHGFKWAEEYSARPGHSEHQTGLAIDIVSKSTNFDSFEKTKEYQWLQDNSYKYGFILRYSKENEYITGYSYESWHYRYVGVDAATIIYNEKLTFEEYYAYYVKNKQI